MPNRVIRDSVLDSDRYVGLTHDSERLLFLELILMADDFGLVPMNFAFLRRRASPCAGKSERQVNEMVEQLVERDLVRLYRSDSDSMFGFIPRFGNAPRAKKPKWPLPPEQPAFNEINELARSCIANAGKCTASAQHLQTNAPETETETETETHKSTSSSSTKVEAPRKRAAPKPKASKSCPDDFEPDSELIAWALLNAPGVDWTRETLKFKTHTFKTAHSDWSKTWRAWMLRAHEFMQQRIQTRQPAKPSRHTGFDKTDYRDGVNDDGSF